jgi:hypothetical protein
MVQYLAINFMNIQIPTRLNELLAKNRARHGAVSLTLSFFEPWLVDNKLPFFPESTDHGTTHISEVIKAAEALICDSAWEVLTSEDAATLILAILLHEIGMHLSEEGFVALISTSDKRQVDKRFSDKPWRALWNDFLSEASRWDGKKLTAIFGEPEPIRTPPFDPQEMTLRDRLLIGEFLRRHHPRLAHEIARYGVPSNHKTFLTLSSTQDGLYESLPDLACLVARSHGLAIRDCIEVLPRDLRREYDYVHVPFLMALVRIADYIQIHSQRAPKQVLRVRGLKSPISQGEFKAHHAIQTINATPDDPEALFIRAKPSDVNTYLKLKRLLSNIQAELDASWATLGEIYGGHPGGLDKLGLTIRRIRSNLDNEAEFAKTVSYVPSQVSFDAAGVDLLKLLVAPLYGNNPEIGIRELIQNAVDACRELEDYLANNPVNEPLDRLKQEADVIVHLIPDKGEKSGWLIVSDRGIGMTAEVVRNYFLRAGASFRRSDAWKKLHTDEKGQSRVLRSGRFGVGVLAAFLLGEHIEVTTRHVTEKAETAISFSCSIDDDEIQLNRTTAPIGMTIRVRITDSTILKSLLVSPYRDTWDLYCLSTPSVQRKIRNKVLNQQYSCLLPHSKLSPEWRRITHEDYEDIYWSFNEKLPTIVCNGIKVDHYWRKSLWNGDGNAIDIERPKISVFDPYGNLPLNLQRTDLVTELSFSNELIEDICRDILAYLLVNAPTIPKNLTLSNYSRQFTGYQYCDSFFSTPKGTALVDIWHLSQIDSSVLLIPSIGKVPSYFYQNKQHEGYISIYYRFNNISDDKKEWFRFSSTGDTNKSFGPTKHLSASSRHLLMTRHFSQSLKKVSSIPQKIWAQLEEEWSNEDWVLFKQGKCPKPTFDFKQAAASKPKNELESIAEWYLDNPPVKTPVTELSPLAKAWKEIIRRLDIPYDLDERRSKLAHAYEILAPYIESHEELKWREKIR